MRAAFISDLHLGARECQAVEIADFLRRVETDELYLVGDIIDLWSMRRGIYWPAAHHEVLRLVIDKARRGTRVVYIPGNHDDLARALVGSLLAGVEVHEEYVHTTQQGMRMLVIHGDAFDGAVRFSPLLKATGSALYSAVLLVGRYVSLLRMLCGLRRWSLATWLKSRVGNAMVYVRRYEQTAARVAAARGLDGIICGHIHRPNMERIDGVLYCNDGDWVEHCTALVEDRNGELHLWRHRSENLQVVAATDSLREAA
ncbi:MAG: UDP-2,3-diacylglucosamine diphosphatase [Pseudomonadota bacterium]